MMASIHSCVDTAANSEKSFSLSMLFIVFVLKSAANLRFLDVRKISQQDLFVWSMKSSISSLPRPLSAEEMKKRGSGSHSSERRC